jgi:hypothetical protein
MREEEGKEANSLPYSLPNSWEDGNPFDGCRELVEDSGFISLSDTSKGGESEEDLFPRLRY